MAFALRDSSGFVCVALPAERCDALVLPARSHRHGSTAATFCVTVDASEGVSTGMSAVDRTRTARLLAEPRAGEDDFTRPGHGVPLAVAASGVLGYVGLAEAAFDLALLADEGGVFGLVASPGEPTRMATAAELRQFGETHDFTVLDLADQLEARREPGDVRPLAGVTA